MSQSRGNSPSELLENSSSGKGADRAWKSFLDNLKASTHFIQPSPPELLSVKSLAEKLKAVNGSDNYPTPADTTSARSPSNLRQELDLAHDDDVLSPSEANAIEDYIAGTNTSKRRRTADHEDPRKQVKTRHDGCKNASSTVDLSPSDSVSNTHKRKTRLTKSSEQCCEDGKQQMASKSETHNILPDVNYFRRRLSITSSADSLRMECALVDSAIDLLSRSVRSTGTGLDLLDARSSRSDSQQAVQQARQLLCSTLISKGFPAAQQMYAGLQLMLFDDLRSQLTSQLSQMALQRDEAAFQAALPHVEEAEEDNEAEEDA